ncbi:extracellular solute-binding protein [Paenibacillus sp. IITD108]|uniref:extracellular solute-binding protein n=1 Tax=Paenibacillus sp. IITD108 TaxID=3116649 RepID=UPI002F3E7543
MKWITRRKRILIASLLLLGLCLVILITASAGDASKQPHLLEPAKTKWMMTETPTLSQLPVNPSYEEYMRYYAGKPRATAEHTIRASQFSAADDSEIKVWQAGYQGDETAIWTGDSGTVHWDVYVPEEGLYQIGIRYFPVEGNNSPIERELLIDGSAPFIEASRLVFSRVWRSEHVQAERNARGDDLRPRQVEEPIWQDVVLRDTEGYYKEPFSFYLAAGSHRLSFNALREPMVIDSIRLFRQEETLSYAEVFESYPELDAGAEGIMLKIQGEDAALKSNPSLYPINDRSSPATKPYDVSRIRMNTIGGVNWKVPGQWIEWEIDVPKDGFYHLGARYRQNANRGTHVVRKLYIDGKVPFKEVEEIPFSYGGAWQIGMPGEAGEPYQFYLTEGKHTIRLELTLGEVSDVIRLVRGSIQQLNAQYLKIVMLTSTVPDPFRDYELERKIPDLVSTLMEQSELLDAAAARMNEIVGETSGSTAILRTTSYQLADMASRTETMTSRLKQFKDNISALGTWLLTIHEQPLEIDYLFLKTPDMPIPSDRVNWTTQARHELMSFVRSFTEDYNYTPDIDRIGEEITVWISSGRDQAQLLRSMIDNSFTPQTGIHVNLQLVHEAVVLPATLAGKGPDIALAQSDVINFAIRGALQDLTVFADFEDVRSRFFNSAFAGFTFQEGIFAVPETQTYPMLFYRQDILNELGLEVPQTWTDMYSIIPELQKRNMELALPHTTVFEGMLYQSGGQFYQADGIATDIDSSVGIETFRRWTELYTNYKLPLEFDFINRFRTGEMPLGIADYTTYNFLTVFAPEIRGQWSFAPLPGKEQADGTIRREALSSATGTIMFSRTENKEAAWTFMKWWTDTEAQLMFGREMEAILGESARYAAAGIETIRRLPWSAKELEKLMTQMNDVIGRPAVPGGYSFDRHLNNAFYEVYNTGSDPRETIENYARTINQEITIKRQEFNLETMQQ